MKKLFLIPLLIVLVLALSLPLMSGCPAPPPAAKVYELNIQSAWPRGDLSMETLKEFAAAADKRSNGQLKISIFGAPEIVGMFEVAEAVKKGTLDMGHGAGNLWSGIIPVGDVEFGLPYGYRIPEEKTFTGKANAIRKFFFESGFIDLLREQYATQGVYYLDIHPYGPVPFMVATKPIVTVNDFKGLRIRTDGLWMEWENGCGANGVDLPGDEAYMALKMGTVDASIWDVSGVTGLHWNEVAPYWIHGEEDDQTIGNILVNMSLWNELPDNLKQALAGAAEDYWYACLAAYEKDMAVCYDLVKQGKLTEVWMDDELIALHEKVGYALWDEVASRDAAAAKAVQLIKDWRGVK
jgi:TRAP-type mannitol/chloroaromatic compound transport system substrate-binding protein